MIDHFIRPMALSELGNFYKYIEQDFPPDEYPPYEVMYNHLQEGIQEGLVFCNQSKDLAYAICAASHSNDYILVSQLAVFPEYRGQGIGSTFVKTMFERYVQKQGILVEVERPAFSETPEEQELRQRRIGFYENLGFYVIPDIDFSIWDVPMHLMALPLNASAEIINQDIGHVIYQIYHSLMGQRFIHKLEFQRL
jgi:GNAT superfamily N-acetyltransferase